MTKNQYNSLSQAHIARRIKLEVEPDWAKLLLELRDRGVTCKALATILGIDGSCLRWLIHGTKQKKPTRHPRWVTGQLIIAAHNEFCGKK